MVDDGDDLGEARVPAGEVLAHVADGGFWLPGAGGGGVDVGEDHVEGLAGRDGVGHDMAVFADPDVQRGFLEHSHAISGSAFIFSTFMVVQ